MLWISSVRLFFFVCSLFLTKIKRSTGTQGNNQKVWSFSFDFFFSFFCRSFSIVYIIWIHGRTLNDEQHVAMDNIFWRVVPLYVLMQANILYISFVHCLFLFVFFFFNFIRDIIRRNIRRKTFKPTKERERKETKKIRKT